MLVSVHFNLIPQEKAIKLLKKQRTNINAKLEVIQKKSAREGIDSSMISPDLTEAQTEANNLMSEITKDNGHLFTTTFVITLFAENQAKLKGYEKQMQAIASKNMVTIKPLGTLKEFGFNTSLPLGNRQLDIQRLMTSDTICAMNPFNVKEVKQKGGLYYGLNAASRNMILYDRTTDLNPNAIILGMPGAGKSFSAKREIINVLLNENTQNDEIYILDPENQYQKLTESFGGSEVKIANGSPMFMSIHLI